MPATTRRDGRTLVVELNGDWSITGDMPPFDAVTRDALASEGDGATVEAVTFDASALETWDSSLLAFVREGVEQCDGAAVDLRLDALPDDVQRLIALSRAVPEQRTRSDDAAESGLARLGGRVVDAGEGFLDFATFTGEVTRSVVRLLTRRVRLRWREFWVIVQSASASALPIVTLISFLVGLILSFLGAVVLKRFGADYYVSYLVSYGMLRELGALMTAIIMSGRTGAAFAAELGSMKITEEIDALRTLGLSPIDVLVLPRVLAIFAVMPLLTVYADVIGILGGWAVAISMLDVTTPQFFTGLTTPVTLADVSVGIVKGTVYGAIIGVAGCLRGMQTGNDAAAVGDATTSAVVTGITLIILANALIDWMAAVLQI